jgi:hypothetical protein
MNKPERNREDDAFEKGRKMKPVREKTWKNREN